MSAPRRLDPRRDGRHRDANSSPDELVSEAANRNRRVATQVQAIADTLRLTRDHGAAAAFVNDNAKQRKTAEGRQSAPVYFGGADNEAAEPEDVVDPPPCAYGLDAATADELTSTFDLHDIAIRASGEGDVALSMAQPAEPVVPLLLDECGRRSVADATPRYEFAPGQ